MRIDEGEGSRPVRRHLPGKLYAAVAHRPSSPFFPRVYFVPHRFGMRLWATSVSHAVLGREYVRANHASPSPRPTCFFCRLLTSCHLFPYSLSLQVEDVVELAEPEVGLSHLPPA